MKTFEAFRFDPRQCRRELDEFKVLLDARADLDERRDLLPFFRQRRHLATFIGSYFPAIAIPDRLAFEYDLFGDFTCDLAIGDSQTGQFCFVEFEDAGARSLFVRKASKATPEWSTRFEHGFSQVLDWLWKLADMSRTVEFEHRFGGLTGYEGILVIGRSTGLGLREQQRLRWRRERVMADSKRVHCVTYDELHQHLHNKLRFYEAAFEAEGF